MTAKKSPKTKKHNRNKSTLVKPLTFTSAYVKSTKSGSSIKQSTKIKTKSFEKRYSTARHKESLSAVELLFRNKVNRLKNRNSELPESRTKPKRTINQMQSNEKLKLNLETIRLTKKTSMLIDKIISTIALKKAVTNKEIKIQPAKKILVPVNTASKKNITTKKTSNATSKEPAKKRQLSTTERGLREILGSKKTVNKQTTHKHTPSCTSIGKISLKSPSTKTPTVPKTSRVVSIKQGERQPQGSNALKKTVPLSKESLKMLEKIKDSEGIAKYIKDYIKKYNKPPKTTIDFYRIGRVLGAGAFGKVNLGMHKLTGKLVAIKSIKKVYLEDEESKKRLMQEISILKNLKHPNIIRLYESFETDKHILIVMELCTGGDLLNYITKRKRLSEDMAKFVFRAIINGLAHCHRHGILHRDIKLDNILINTEGELKICDFGVSKAIKKNELMTEKCGTPAYIAPEILKTKGYKGFASDLWSAGVALYAILYGTIPFKSTSVKDLYEIILKGKISFKDDISEEARNLLMSLLERNPKKRITSAGVLGHNWMQGINPMSLFTEEEKTALIKETLRGRKVEGKADTFFSEQNIDSTINEVNKNNMTKSIILAPYNSSCSDNTISDSDKEYDIIDKTLAIKFSANVKDLDRQYEKNNNCDIDNGVYTKFIFNSKEDKQKLEVIDNVDDSGSIAESIETLENEVEGISTNTQEIDKNALEKMKAYGYTKEYMTKCLNDNELNYATATYYLLTNHYF